MSDEASEMLTAILNTLYEASGIANSRMLKNLDT